MKNMFLCQVIANSSLRIILIIACLIVISPTTLAAQESGSSALNEGRREMIRISNEATNDVLEGRFEDGARKFQQAYELYPDPVLLKNQMVAWFRAGNCTRSVSAANAFLDSGEASLSDQRDIQQVRFTCSMQIATQALEMDELAVAEQAYRRAAELAVNAEQQQQVDALQNSLVERGIMDINDTTDSDKTTEELTPPPEVSKALPSWPGWTMLGTGAVVLATNIVYHGISIDRQTRLKDNPPTDQVQWETLRDQVALAYWLNPTLYAISGTLAAGGITYLIVQSNSKNTHQRVELEFVPPSTQLGLAGMRLNWRF